MLAIIPAALLLVAAGLHAIPAPSGVVKLDVRNTEGGPVQQLVARFPTDYEPRAVDCPATLVRKVAKPSSMTGAKPDINVDEGAYVGARQPIVRKALLRWLDSIGAGFDFDLDGAVASNSVALPTLALALSGGGFRAMLNGAGVMQALDAREKHPSKLKGLYQALTFQAGLSGGGWLLSSIVGNDWPTVTDVKETLWDHTLPLGPLLPSQGRFLFSDADLILAIASKAAKGYDMTLVDVYGRLLSYALLNGTEGGIAQTLSSVVRSASFQSHDVPYPIITAVDAPDLQKCGARPNSTQYEFTPYEFGSWDVERAAFIPTRFAGSVQGADGELSCVRNFDNLGFVLGTSSDILTYACEPLSNTLLEGLQAVGNFTQRILRTADDRRPAVRSLYGAWPNTFVRQGKPAVAYPPKGRSHSDELYLVDGGFSGQQTPIWPFLHREVDVLFVSDGASNTLDRFPDGSDLYNTYAQAQLRGLTRMPYIPDNATFQARGYNKRPTFFGCDEPEPVMTIIYLPNYDYVFPSNSSTYRQRYSRDEIDGMLANGRATATYNETVDFEVCVACAVMKKTAALLPGLCTQCFDFFCANK